MEASGQTGPAEDTGSMPEGEVSGAMTAPAAETTPVVPEGPNTTTTSFFTPPMDPSRLADHLFDPVSGVRVDARGQRIPPGMVPQIVFDPTLGRPVQIGWVDPQFQRQDVPFSPAPSFSGCAGIPQGAPYGSPSMRDEPVQSGYYGIPPGDDIFGPQPTETVRMSTTLSPRANPYGTGFFGRAPGGERGPMYGPCPMGPPPGMPQQPQQQQQVPLQQQQVPQQFPQQLPQAPQVSLEQVLQQQTQLLAELARGRGGQDGPPRERGMDSKWIPAAPTPEWKNWSTRAKELSGFRNWLERFGSWMSLIHDQYGAEMREAIRLQHPVVLVGEEQSMRARRLFHLLQQSFAGYNRVESMIRNQIAHRGVHEGNGFEFLRLIRREFSLFSRTEALYYREQCLQFRAKPTTGQTLIDVLREVGSEIESFHGMLESSLVRDMIQDLRISEGDQFLLYLRNLPEKVREWVQLHSGAINVMQLWHAVNQYFIRTRVHGDMERVKQVNAEEDILALEKSKDCYNCGKPGHLAKDCPQPKKCKHCGKSGHEAADCWQKYPDKKPKKGVNQGKPSGGKPGAKPSAKPGKPKSKAKGKAKGKFREVTDADADADDADEEDAGDEPEGEDDGDAAEAVTMMISTRPTSERTSVGVSESGRTEYLGAHFSSDPKFQWLVDSGATCHIISRQHLSDYFCEQVNLPLPSLKGAGNAPIEVFGIVDVKFKVGNKKFVLSKAVVADIDVNVISCYALMEAGWETVFGKKSGLYTGNLRLPLFMSERAWWLHVGSQKSGGVKKRTTKNRPKPMDLDAVRTSDSKETGTETTASSLKAEATKELTQESSAQETVAAAAKGSSSKKGNKSKGKRREQRDKEMVMQGFSYVCRMLHFGSSRLYEPNTFEEQDTSRAQFLISDESASDVESCEFESCVSEDFESISGDCESVFGVELDVEPIVEENIWDQFIAPGNGFSSESGEVTSEGEFEGCTEESSDPEDQESCHEHEMQDGTLILEENLNGFTYGVFGNVERGSCSHGVFGEESCHMFRGFPQHVNVDSGDEDADSAYEPTEGCVSEGNSFMDVSTPDHSDGGGRGEIREEQPMAPVPEEEPFEPVMEGSSLLDHECRGHWPYDKGCVACCQARGRTPARRRAQKDESSSPHLAADYFYVGGRYWRILILLMINTGVVGLVVMGGDTTKDVRSVANVLNEIGVGGLNLEVCSDNEASLVNMLTKGLQASSCRSFHWRNAAENRPQAKGVERACGILKEGIFSNWLGLERHLHARVALESPLMGFLVGHAYRTYNCFNNRSGSSPLERMGESRGGQCPRSFCFGVLGYGKPVNPNVWPGRRLVSGCYLGMRFITGGGCLLFPADADANGVREVIRCHSFRVKEVVNINEAFDADLLFPLLAGVMPEVDDQPNIAGEPAPLQDAPRPMEDVLPPVGDAEPASGPAPSPFSQPERVAPREEPVPSRPSAPPLVPDDSGAADMDVEPPDNADAYADVPMTLDELTLEEVLEHTVQLHQTRLWNEFCLQGTEMQGTSQTLELDFGGTKVLVDTPENSHDELTGLPMIPSEVSQAMKVEIEELERLKVGTVLSESEGRRLGKENKVQVLTSRWVITQKAQGLARCRLVVRDFATGESAFHSGIYSPTSSQDGLRAFLAVCVARCLTIFSLDVSVAFMHAPTEEGSLDLVLLPNNIRTKRGRERAVYRLHKAMNGLRRAPLLWFIELQRTVYKLGGTETFESTLFRLEGKKGGLILLLVYVDDLLVASENPDDANDFIHRLEQVWKMKRTGQLIPKKQGVINFLGRTIYRLEGEIALYFGVTQKYMEGVFQSWGEKLKAGGKNMPQLESLHAKALENDQEITEEAAAKYRRVLGQLAWCALSRGDLAFPVSFLARFQSKPSAAAEQCMRAFLKWLVTRLHYVQRMPAENPPYVGESEEIVCFCDASWSVNSVSGALLLWEGYCLKFFSRRQEVPALSSAEAEVISLCEAAKEMVSMGMLMETILKGIPLDALGMPLVTTGTWHLRMYNDARAALSIAQMEGLLRRVRHLELRVKYLQNLSRRKRLSLAHWAGVENSADGLTKSLKELSMWINLSSAIGLVEGCDTAALKSLKLLSGGGGEDDGFFD